MNLYTRNSFWVLSNLTSMNTNSNGVEIVICCLSIIFHKLFTGYLKITFFNHIDIKKSKNARIFCNILVTVGKWYYSSMKPSL